MLWRAAAGAFFVAEKLVPTISVAQINKKTGKKEKVHVLENALK